PPPGAAPPGPARRTRTARPGTPAPSRDPAGAPGPGTGRRRPSVPGAPAGAGAPRPAPGESRTGPPRAGRPRRPGLSGCRSGVQASDDGAALVDGLLVLRPGVRVPDDPAAHAEQEIIHGGPGGADGDVEVRLRQVVGEPPQGAGVDHPRMVLQFPD